MLRISEPYQPRFIRFMDQWTVGPWRMKVYSINDERAPLAPPLIEAARRLAAELLPPDPDRTHQHGIGFIIIHKSVIGGRVHVLWWSDEHQLHHRVFAAPWSHPTEFEPMPDMAGCVWELALIGYERDAWVEEVLRRHNQPAVEQYLALHLNANV